MSSVTYVNMGPYTHGRCQNDSRVYDAEDLNPIKDLDQRVTAGDIMPIGECPKCGALCEPGKVGPDGEFGREPVQ